jgi:hypothetical protein
VLPQLAAQLPHLAVEKPVSYSVHLQYAAGTGGKQVKAKKSSEQAISVAVQLGRGLKDYIMIASGQAVELSSIFKTLSASSSKLSYLTAEMAAGAANMSAAELQRVATTLQRQSGSSGGE